MVEDQLPPGYTDVKLSSGEDVIVQQNTAGTLFQALFGPLANGQSVSMEFDAQLPADAVPECVNNTATITGNEPDPTATCEAITVTPAELGTVKVQNDSYYFLIETHSPLGYSLLAQPVLLQVTRNTVGNAVVTFPRQAGTFLALVETSGTNPDLVQIKLADVHSGGALLQTGGIGWWPFPLGSLTLIIIAAVLLYRRH